MDSGTESLSLASMQPNITFQDIKLPDPDDSSSEEEGPRQLSPPISRNEQSQNLPPSPKQNYSVNNNAWDDFVRKGSRLKNFVEDALQLVACIDGREARKRPLLEDILDEDDDDSTPTKRARFMDAGAHAADLAKEKTAECILLQKKLQDAQASLTALTVANTSLRESTAASNDRMERVTDALRIAGQNSASARCDADAAESYASSLATQLESLRSVVDETKRATESLYQEHELISQAARSLETKLLQRETEFYRSQKERKQLVEEQEKLRLKAKSAEDERKQLESKLECYLQELSHSKRNIQGRDAVEQARKDRSSMVEKELREARSTLVDAASTAAETETTTSVLKGTIQELQKENTSLHEGIRDMQDKSRHEQQRLHESLGNAERECQSLRVKAASHDEEVQHLRSEKNSCEKQVTQLKIRITNLERRLKDATSLMYPPPIEEAPASTKKDTPDHRKPFYIPPLTPARDVSTASCTPKSSICSICSKAASGMMKSCQCGLRGCDRRAHASCVARNGSPTFNSLSHPGSPSPFNLILCDGRTPL